MTKKIIIVDDSKTILKINARMVTTIIPDAEVMVFETPESVIDKFKDSEIKIDFAFLDYNMEGMNGVELATALVGLPCAPLSYDNICIVSANVQEAVMKKAEALKIQFISKPLEVGKLKEFFSKRGVTL